MNVSGSSKLTAGIAAAFFLAGSASAQTPGRAALPAAPDSTISIPTVVTSNPNAPRADPEPELVRQPTRGQLNRSYPPIARRAKVEAFVWLHCVANEDQTLTCDDTQTNVLGLNSQPLQTTPEIRAAFAAAGAGIKTGLRVAPTLPNGKSSAGRHLLVFLPFRLGR